MRFGAAESAQAAYRMAGLGPADIDVAQLYDCFTGLRFGRASYPDGDHAITSWIIEAMK